MGEIFVTLYTKLREDDRKFLTYSIMSIESLDELHHKIEISLNFSNLYFELLCFLFVNNSVNIRMKVMQANNIRTQNVVFSSFILSTEK